MSTERLLMARLGVPPSTPGCSLKAKATDIRSALASATPPASMKGKWVCLAVTFSFRKCALMSQALTRSSSWSLQVWSPSAMCTFSLRNEKSEKLMSLISQSQPLWLPETFSMLMAGRILRMKSRHASFSWLTSASRFSELESAPSALLSISCGSSPWSFFSSSRSMSSFSRCSMTRATALLLLMSWNCVSTISPFLMSSDAPLTTESSSRLLTMASFQVLASWLLPAACASRSLRMGMGTSTLRSPSVPRRPW
mmetsp:Transcript_113071/g.365200  ORF Transcript_113071/g.365200 Transcript_113071/m.365200 type:complete len:254 (-) Transcript_113071:1827-2588(-)